VSFRLRLILFFVLIVVLPMGALAVLVSQIASDSATGKADARLDTGLSTATTLFEQQQAEAREAAGSIADKIARDPAAGTALQSGDQSEIRALAGRLRHEDGVKAVTLTAASGGEVAVGPRRTVAGASVDLVSSSGDGLGTVTVSTTTPESYLGTVAEMTGEDAALVGRSARIAGTVPVHEADLPESGDAADFEEDGDDLRVAATEPLGEERVRVALFAPVEGEGFITSRPTLAIALLAFFAIALLAVAATLRSLQGYVRDMLAAARRIGEGDFSRSVPVSGRDEMAGLANEFNKMSDRLSEQMDQLRRQRIEIEKSVRRVGEAFASGLDRQALLAILVETAVGTCEADYGLVALSGHVGAEAEYGTPTDDVQEAALAAEQGALRDPGPVEESHGSAYAFASSLGRIGQAGAPVGAMTVARSGRPFTPTEREVFLYLVGQAAASVENLALHELVSEQASTDDLTGLANKRAFREMIDREAARAARFRHDVSLLMLDIDDFKQINDTHGHLQGDAVLRAIGRVLTAESRGIDLPARYGGEEFVVALPETDTEGAAEVAERIRARVEAQRIPVLDGRRELRITASLGVASAPGEAAAVQELIAAADAALYEAKRAGKNRVAVATIGATQAATGGRESDPVAKGS
jgi:two-component system, cell cycle response regulator